MTHNDNSILLFKDLVENVYYLLLDKYDLLFEMKNKPIKTNNTLDITIDTGLPYGSENFKYEDKYCIKNSNTKIKW